MLFLPRHIGLSQPGQRLPASRACSPRRLSAHRGRSTLTLPCTRVCLTQSSLERLKTRRLTQIRSYTTVPPLLVILPSALYIFFLQNRASTKTKVLGVSEQDAVCHFSFILISYMRSSQQNSKISQEGSSREEGSERHRSHEDSRSRCS